MFKQNDNELKRTFYNLKSRKDLANLLELKLSTVTFFLNATRKNQYYKNFAISKKNKNKRTINAPQLSLKILLKKLNYIFNLLYPPKPSVHGFVKSFKTDDAKSILTNAQKHTNKRFVLNIDLENFFPTISKNRLTGLFKSKPFNLPLNIASDIAELCTYCGYLPQGAPTSPVLSNMICRKLDNNMQNLAQNLKCTYTRYADDITFSTMKKIFPSELAYTEIEKNAIVTRIGILLNSIIRENGFHINTDKVRLQNYTTRQEVTGLVVNKKVNIKRRYIKQIRAILHDWEKNGIETAVNNFNKKNINSFHLYNPTRKQRLFERVIRGKIEFIGNIRRKDDFIYAKFYNQLNKLTNKKKEHKPENKIEQINRFLWILETESISIQGTAFSIDNGFVISCSHCVFDDTVAYKLNNPSKKYNVKIIKTYGVNEGIDIAVLEIIKNGQTIVEKGFEVGCPSKLKQLDEVLIAGFSNYSVNGDTSKLNFEKITAFKEIPCRYYSKEKDKLLDISIRRIIVPPSIMQGDSGGPVLNKDYQVIGIAAKGIKSNGDVKDDASFEIIPIDAINLT